MEDASRQRQWSEEHVFENMTEFYHFLVPTTLEEMEPRIMTFYTLYSSLENGCGCSRKKRIEQTRVAYLDLENLNSGSKYGLKGVLQVAAVIFKEDGQELFRL